MPSYPLRLRPIHAAHELQRPAARIRRLRGVRLAGVGIAGDGVCPLPVALHPPVEPPQHDADHENSAPRRGSM